MMDAAKVAVERAALEGAESAEMASLLGLLAPALEHLVLRQAVLVLVCPVAPLAGELSLLLACIAHNHTTIT